MYVFNMISLREPSFIECIQFVTHKQGSASVWTNMGGMSVFELPGRANAAPASAANVASARGKAPMPSTF
jgi:hypothetical protein